MLFVTGCNGLVGREFLKAIGGAKLRARALVDEVFDCPGVELVRGNVGQLHTLEGALKGASVLLTLANGPTEHARQGSLLDAAKRAKVKHVIKWSSMGAVKDTPIPLCAWHYKGEEELIRFGIPHTILQPQYFFQYLLHARKPIAAGALGTATKDAKFAMVDVRDFALLVAKIVPEIDKHDLRKYRVTGPARVGFGDVLQALSAAMKRPVKHVEMTPAALRADLEAQGFRPWLVDAFVAGHVHMARGKPTDLLDTLAKVAGVTPRDAQAFAKDYAGWFK